MTAWILDTGPLVSYLDAADADHETVAKRIDTFSGRLLTTGAVITESMYFLSAVVGGPRLLAEFVSDGGVRVYDMAQPAELREAAALMEKYHDTPMDYADATLVLLAEAMSAHKVLTLDRRGFAAYRTRRRRGFRLVLDDAPS